MLAPDRNRLDYGEQLQAPEGYELDAAIATSYSVDLDTLLAVPIALCFGNTLEGDLRGEKLALLEAISRLNKRLKVFYQKGNIAQPIAFNQLFTLLEPCLHAIVPDKAFSSFHPKLWLIRYAALEKNIKLAVRYRFIILSRNLTMDRSWDVAVSLEGELKKKPNKEAANTHWLSWVENLLESSTDFEPRREFLRELPRIHWETPSGFDSTPEIFIGDSEHSPLKFPSYTNDQLLVTSPFLSKAALDDLQSYAPKGERYLFSRAEELNALSDKELSGWKCYSINENMVNADASELEPDDSAVAGKPYNLHAKLIVSRKASRVCWHIGSANATNAALGHDNKMPLNTEAMLRLSGVNSKVGPDVLMEQWVGVEEDEKGLFVRYKAQSEAVDVRHPATNQMREIVFDLINSDWQQEAILRSEDDKYDLHLSVDGFVLHDHHNVEIQVSQLAFGKPLPLIDKMFWSDVAVSEVSAFVPVKVTVQVTGEEDLVEMVMIETDLDIEGGDNRQQEVLKKIVDGEDKILNYISLLLQSQPDKSQWLAFEKMNFSNNNTDGSFFSNSPVYEQLLWAAAEHPYLLKRIQVMVTEFKRAGISLPDDFATLWSHFEKEVPSK